MRALASGGPEERKPTESLAPQATSLSSPRGASELLVTMNLEYLVDVGPLVTTCWPESSNCDDSRQMSSPKTVACRLRCFTTEYNHRYPCFPVIRALKIDPRRDAEHSRLERTARPAAEKEEGKICAQTTKAFAIAARRYHQTYLSVHILVYRTSQKPLYCTRGSWELRG